MEGARSGWLEVFEDGTWTRRWCVLQSGWPVATFTLFSDSGCSSETGLLEITQHSKAAVNEEAPGPLQKDFSFSLQVTPAADPWFFATCDAKRADIWMKALQSAAMEDAQHGPHGMRTMRTTAKHESKCHNV
ncbi:unnamed protein product [Durusdinium trenchii]|uniref:PH domain-containing protein n=1 Tax=Durusdinium trenchii TaxID=1381693 RepID=A0ABP0JY41_9DINO